MAETVTIKTTKPQKNPKTKRSQAPQTTSKRLQSSDRTVNIPRRPSDRSRTRRLNSASVTGYRRVEQSVINGRAFKSLARNVQDIILPIVLPKNYPPTRYAHQYNTGKTAVAPPTAYYPAGWLGTTTYNAAYQALPATEMVGVLFRDPARGAILYDANAARNHGSYDFYGTYADDLAPSNTWFIPNAYAGLLNITMGKATNPLYAPHGSIWLAGAPGTAPQRYFWLDGVPGGTAVVQCQLTGVTNGQTYQLQLNTFCNGVREEATIPTSIVAAGGLATFSVPITRMCYYSFSLVTPTSCTIAYLRYDNQGSFFCHLPLPGLIGKQASFSQIRVLAGSLMYTNAAALNSKEGFVNAAQMPAGTYWTQYLGTPSPLKTLENAFSDEVTEGHYTWLKPTSDDDWKWHRDIDFLSDRITMSGSHYDLFGPCDYLFMNVSISNFAGQDGQWQLAYGVEFCTTDTWYDTRAPRHNGSEFKAAIEQLRDIPQHFENPLHLASLLGFVKSAGKAVAQGIVDYGPSIIGGARAVLPYLN